MSGRLAFNSFSVVWSQIFTLEKKFDPVAFECRFPKDEDATRLDAELFENYNAQQNHLLRYMLPDLDVRLGLQPAEGSRDATLINGCVHVRAAIYFSRTVCISYRFMVDSRKASPDITKRHCQTNHPLAIDDLINLAGAPVGSEHWQTYDRSESSYGVTGNIQSISVKIGEREICNQSAEKAPQGAVAKALNKLFSHHQCLFSKRKDEKKARKRPDRSAPEEVASVGKNSFYALVDVWEDVAHTHEPPFDAMTEKQVIEHIQQEHQKELIGLLTLYPTEWPFRRREHFNLVCGSNIGLDNDDLILLSGSICVIFGTYGRRDQVEEGVQWGSVLNRTRQVFHMSYQEYYFILDLIMAKRHAIRDAMNVTTNHLNSVSKEARQEGTIQSLCELFVNISQGVMELDILKHSRFEALRIQATQTELRLGIPEAYRDLTALLTRMDGAIKTIDSIREQKRRRHLSQLLLFISVAAILGVIFDEPEFALFRDLLHWLKESGFVRLSSNEQTLALYVAEFVLAATLLFILFFAISHLVSSWSSQNALRKKNKCQ